MYLVTDLAKISEHSWQELSQTYNCNIEQFTRNLAILVGIFTNVL